MEQLNNLINNLKQNQPNFANPESVKDWFLNNNIRVCEPQDGDKTSLWFCLADVAKIIDDKNYARFTSKYRHQVTMKDRNGTNHTYNMVSEMGLYQYLLRSKRPAAQPFQEWVYDVLINIRKELVSKQERDLALAQQEISAINANLPLLHSVSLRHEYGFSEDDIYIIELCNKNKIKAKDLSEEQLSELRDHNDDVEAIDEELVQMKEAGEIRGSTAYQKVNQPIKQITPQNTPQITLPFTAPVSRPNRNLGYNWLDEEFEYDKKWNALLDAQIAAHKNGEKTQIQLSDAMIANRERKILRDIEFKKDMEVLIKAERSAEVK